MEAIATQIRWEYTTLYVTPDDISGLEDCLNAIGDLGWEAVGVGSGLIVLKRPKSARNVADVTWTVIPNGPLVDITDWINREEIEAAHIASKPINVFGARVFVREYNEINYRDRETVYKASFEPVGKEWEP